MTERTKVLRAAMIGLATMSAALPTLVHAQANTTHQVIYAPRTDTFTTSNTHQGPNVAGSAIHIVNGTELPGQTYTSPGGSANGGGTPTSSYSSASQNGGAGSNSLYSETAASASLEYGRLRATVGATGPDNFGTPTGTAQARIDDTIFFTNTTGSDLMVSFTYAFDGLLTDSNGSANPGGDLSLLLSCDFFRCYNGSGAGAQAIRFAETGKVAGSNMNYYFRQDGPSYFGENIYGGPNNNFTTGLSPMSGIGGVVDGWITANLLVPTGLTSLGIRATLDLSCGGGSQCDFGNTAQLSFGPLPVGLTYGSASGSFLTALAQPTGAVPEPATWAMMIAGFGLVGAAMRRRPSALAAA